MLNGYLLRKSRNSCAESAEWGDNCKKTEDIENSLNCVVALLDTLAFESTIHWQAVLILPIELKLCIQKKKCV